MAEGQLGSFDFKLCSELFPCCINRAEGQGQSPDNESLSLEKRWSKNNSLAPFHVLLTLFIFGQPEVCQGSRGRLQAADKKRFLGYSALKLMALIVLSPWLFQPPTGDARASNRSWCLEQSYVQEGNGSTELGDSPWTSVHLLCGQVPSKSAELTRGEELKVTSKSTDFSGYN